MALFGLQFSDSFFESSSSSWNVSDPGNCSDTMSSEIFKTLSRHCAKRCVMVVWTLIVLKVKSDNCSKFSNLSNWKEEAWKSGASTGFEPVTYELNRLTSLPMCGFIAQLVEHRTGIAEVTGSNPIEALIFFRLLSNCLNWKIYCDDHSSLSSTTAVQMWIIPYKLHINSLSGKFVRFWNG